MTRNSKGACGISLRASGARRCCMLAVAGLIAAAAPAVQAGVSAAEAARLKTDLMPLGGEKAGNKEGTIPAWAGGYTTPIPGDKPGGRRGDPFKDDKPLFSITAKNLDQYADKLSDGQKALLKKYPEYRLDVYKTQRTAAAPQWVYDNTFKNATRASLNGDLLEGAFGGVPFPIPKTGVEVMWNHLLRWRGSNWTFQAANYQITADGGRVMVNDGEADLQMPYFDKDSSVEEFERTKQFWRIRIVSVGPPVRAGEALTGYQATDFNEAGWIYLTGQRRVRKLPSTCCDTPSPSTAGVTTFDEIETFLGKMDRFDWKLVGKQEMFVPYNNNRLLQPKTDAEVLGRIAYSPDYTRWELHRVWVVEANLRPGKRHVAPRSRYYCDEDTWLCLLGDRWDAHSQLWRTVYSTNIVAPDIPGTISAGWGLVDLLSNQAFIGNVFNAKSVHMGMRPKYPDSVFSPDALAGEGVR